MPAACRDRPATGRAAPTRSSRTARRRRSTEQHRDHGRDQAGRGAQPVQPGQRRPQHEDAVAAPPERRDPPVEPGPRLEGVAAVEPAAAVEERGEQLEGGVERDRGPQGAQRGRVGRDQLEPGERRRGPPPRATSRDRRAAGGRRPGDRAQRAVEQCVHRPQRVQLPPDRSEQHRGGHEPDPEQHVHDLGHGVEGVVRAEQQREQGPARPTTRPRPASARRNAGASSSRASPAGRGRPACGGVQAGFAPEQAEQHERQHHRGGGARDRPAQGERAGPRGSRCRARGRRRPSRPARAVTGRRACQQQVGVVQLHLVDALSGCGVNVICQRLCPAVIGFSRSTTCTCTSLVRSAVTTRVDLVSRPSRRACPAAGSRWALDRDPEAGAAVRAPPGCSGRTRRRRPCRPPSRRSPRVGARRRAARRTRPGEEHGRGQQAGRQGPATCATMSSASSWRSRDPRGAPGGCRRHHTRAAWQDHEPGGARSVTGRRGGVRPALAAGRVVPLPRGAHDAHARGVGHDLPPAARAGSTTPGWSGTSRPGSRSCPATASGSGSCRAGIANPVWVDDERFDISYHVRRSALPRPGTAGAARGARRPGAGRPLDRSRPLWEVIVVEGLQDGGFAVVTKVHQALVDGVHAVDLGQVVLDDDEDGHEPPAAHLAARPRAERRSSSSPPRSTDTLRRPQQLVDTARAGLGDLLSTGGRALEALGGLALAAGRHPAAPEPAERGDRRSPPVRDARHRPGGLPPDPRAPPRRAPRRRRPTTTARVNDVVLATLTGALRTWLLGRGVGVGPGDRRSARWCR